MSKPDDVAYYYHGDGADVEYIPGAPARDVTVAEYEALAPEHKRAVQQTTVARGDKRQLLYSPSKAKPKAVEPEPLEPDVSPDDSTPGEGEKG